MKKIIIVSVLSLFIFTGCGTSKLSTSDNLPDSSSRELIFLNDDFIYLEEMATADLRYNGYNNASDLVGDYVETMDAKVSSVNAAGGTSGTTFTIVNDTIVLLNNLVDYLNTERFNIDLARVYAELIVIRDNMIKIGFMS